MKQKGDVLSSRNWHGNKVGWLSFHLQQAGCCAGHGIYARRDKFGVNLHFLKAVFWPRGNSGHLNHFGKKEASNDVWLVVTCTQVESLDTDVQNFASSLPVCSYCWLEIEAAWITQQPKFPCPTLVTIWLAARYQLKSAKCPKQLLGNVALFYGI